MNMTIFAFGTAALCAATALLEYRNGRSRRQRLKALAAELRIQADCYRDMWNDMKGVMDEHRELMSRFRRHISELTVTDEVISECRDALERNRNYLSVLRNLTEIRNPGTVRRNTANVKRIKQTVNEQP